MHADADSDRQPTGSRRTVARYALGVVVGAGLFAATVLGALALQGRMNYEVVNMKCDDLMARRRPRRIGSLADRPNLLFQLGISSSRTPPRSAGT